MDRELSPAAWRTQREHLPESSLRTYEIILQDEVFAPVLHLITVKSLDEAIEYLADDELLEVTPESYRIRKRILNTDIRMREDKRRSQLVSQ